jgi:hypothetical protein
MRKTKRWALLLIVALLALATVAFAQDIEPLDDADIDPNANISWPLPVVVLRGTVTLQGSANLSNMTNYYVEYRAITGELSAGGEDAPWLPATLPNSAAVLNAPLGTWDTTIVPDGIYELRLVINTTEDTPAMFRVSPVRVQNQPSPFETLEPAAGITATLSPIQAVQGTATALAQGQGAVATQPPQQNATSAPASTIVDTTPRVIGNETANVRRGDSIFYNAIGALEQGDEAQILGISSRGSGWFFVELENGRQGWISPVVVTVIGDTTGVPSIEPPPPPPPTATPTPIPTPTIAYNVNLEIEDVDISPYPLTCGVTSKIEVEIRNEGSTSTGQGFSVFVRDTEEEDGDTVETTVGAAPPLGPGEVFEVDMFLTVDDQGGEDHRLSIFIDSANVIPETNEGDNAYVTEYYLEDNC